MTTQIPNAAAIDRELVRRRGLLAFVEAAWPLVEPSPFVPGWHLRLIAEHLERIAKGHERRLVICVPPGAMKSLLSCVFFPAWWWTWNPSAKLIFASYSQSLARRDGERTLALVSSDWYRERWPNVIVDESDSAIDFTTKSGGLRIATSVGGQGTGRHADALIVDDPHKAQDAFSRTALAATREWWASTMSSRLANPATARKVVIGQRLHADDLPGACIDDGDYQVVRLPMRFEKEEAHADDPRRVDGELLWPERFPERVVAQLERDMGAMTAAAQLQQRPVPAGGGLFRRDWIRTWHALPGDGTWLQSWDLSFKGAATSDYVVGQVWLASGGRYYLVDQVRARMSFSATCDAMRMLSAKWPKARLKLVEAAANGEAVASALKHSLPGIVLVRPEGGKESRANAIAPLWEAGNVLISEQMSDSIDFIDELLSFPLGRHDDQVDAMTQALVRLSISRTQQYVLAMQRLAKDF
ncbi:MAG: phage terminase large subunit [Sandaracinaceae bacterium]|nr:phage terminase large subunit [Sandaracinaceae bacterium]